MMFLLDKSNVTSRYLEILDSTSGAVSEAHFHHIDPGDKDIIPKYGVQIVKGKKAHMSNQLLGATIAAASTLQRSYCAGSPSLIRPLGP